MLVSSRELRPATMLWLLGFRLTSSMYAYPALIGAVESVRIPLGKLLAADAPAPKLLWKIPTFVLSRLENPSCFFAPYMVPAIVLSWSSPPGFGIVPYFEKLSLVKNPSS